MGVCTKLRIIFYTFVRRSLDLMRDDMILLSHLLRIINLTYILYNSAIISSYEYLALKILLLSCTSFSYISGTHLHIQGDRCRALFSPKTSCLISALCILYKSFSTSISFLLYTIVSNADT